MQRRIVCAANKIRWETIRADGEELLLGVRHWDDFMRNSLDNLYGYFQNAVEITELEEGFIDSTRQFLSRTDAWEVAKAAGQIIRRVGGDTADGGTLYSENLY